MLFLLYSWVMGGKIWQAFERTVRGFQIWIRHWIISGWGIMCVWRVSNFQEFRYFCEPYIEQAIKDNRKILYFRFASHEPLVKECPQVERIEIPLSHRFEDFTVKIHKIIEKKGTEKV